MSKTSGGPARLTSVPKGGGAIKGIGETFSSDLFTGTGHLSLPITLPPGRNGVQPPLNLSYSTGAGNGPFGLGWDLSVSEVSRRTAGGVPRYDDGASTNGDLSESSDTFMLSGSESLIPVARPSPGVTLYRPRTESLFARIEHHTADGQDFWQVRGKDGLVSTYGTPRPADAPADWQDPATLADPHDSRKIFCWKLSEAADPFGNRIVYEYRLDRADDGSRAWAQLYLERVRYVEFRDAQGDEQFLISVSFEYSDRPDPFSIFRPGFQIRTRLRCDGLAIRTHPDDDRLVRRMAFHYEPAGHNRVSLLTQVELIGGDEVDRMPPLTFGYTPFAPEKRRLMPVDGQQLPDRSLAGENLELADLFGRGLPDFVQIDGTGVRYWRNLGGGRFDLPRQMATAPAGVDLADPAVRLLDADGDGRIDLAVYSGALPGYFPLTLDGEFDGRSFQPQRVAPSFSLTDPDVQLVDLDGDGVTDAIRSGARFELFFQDRVEGWHESVQIERRTGDDFPDLSFGDPRVRWVDMSGDGLQDVVLVHDGSIEYWPNLGRGRFAPKILMRNSPRLPAGYDPRRLLFGDVDGDGLTDLVYVDEARVLLWINQGGEAWSAPIAIAGTPPVTDLGAVRFVDLLGTGVAGLLWTVEAGGLSRERMFYLDVAGAAKPYLLTEMASNTGALTRIEYAPSTRFFLADEARRAARWKTPLPFPVQVVARTETIDQLSGGKLVTTYRYHHGCWDGGEAEFRGFAMVEQFDTQTFDEFHDGSLHERRAFAAVEPALFSPPTLARTWFHVGPVGEEHGDWEEIDWSGEYWPGDPPMLDHLSGVNAFLRSLPDRPARRDALRALRGAMLRQELYALDGSDREDRPYNVSEQAYGVREELPLADGDTSRTRIFFTHTLAQRVTQWERGDEPMTRFDFKQNHDAFGQPLDQVAIACPRNWRALDDRLAPDTPFLATYIRTDYAVPDDDAIYIRDRVARTTSFHLKHLGAQSVADLHAAIANPSALDVFAQTLTYYDGDAFVGLPFGRVGRFGAPVRSESLALTEAIVAEAYGGAAGPGIPPYLVPGPSIAWTAEYPEGFRNGTEALAGYVFHDGSGEQTRGYFISSSGTRYDVHNGPGGHGLAVATETESGATTIWEFDRFALLPERITDALGLVQLSRYDYRVLQPEETTDPNGNRMRYRYSGLGSLTDIIALGKDGEDVGDTPDAPGTRFEYDLLAFHRSPPNARRPISVRTIQREHHARPDGDPPPAADRDATMVRVEYSDGFGRVIQRRVQAEAVRFGNDAFGTDIIPVDLAVTPGASVGRAAAADAPNVLVTGAQVYDNKGQVVEQFEPYFATGFDYVPPALDDRGLGCRIFYDPRGLAIRTLHPNGSVKRVIPGVPRQLDTPEDFVPTPWESYTYDENDNAASFPGVSHVDPAQMHTPASVEVDALGRAVASAAHAPGSDPIVVRTEYDIRGNARTITDALGRTAFRCVYDLASSHSHVLREEDPDRGGRCIVPDATGREIERRDGKGALVLQIYDAANRPVRLWARDAADRPVALRQRLVYGDAAGLAQPAAANLLGKLFQLFDEAGLVEHPAFDFKGNPTRQVRRVIRDEVLIAAMDASAPVLIDWEAPGAEDALESRRYEIDLSHDGMSRLREARYPTDASGDRKVLVPHHGRSGHLERLSLRSADGTEQVFVRHIAYNARGQRSLIAYGNGVMTRYAYEDDTFRLARVRTERFEEPAPFTFAPAGGVLQDVRLTHDLNGNLVRLRDESPGCGIDGSADGLNALERVFGYDALNRLVSATGREHALRVPSGAPWLDGLLPTPQDVTAARQYREEYDYDAAGNLLEVRHRAPDGARDYTRRFAVNGAGNRLDAFSQGGSTFDLVHDRAGNLLSHAQSHDFTWNHADRLAAFRVHAGGGPSSLDARYLYDALGQRVKKVVRRAGGVVETAVYIGNAFEHHTSRDSGGVTRAQSLLHLMDDQRRVAVVRTGEAFADDAFPAVRFELADHLGSSVITLDATGTELRREEYYPYGDTSFGSFARKRYRFTGRERDDESGLGYHRRRYYAPWLMRWVTPDPAGREDGLNLYRYARSQPLGLVDPQGTSAWSWTKSALSTVWSYTKDFARFNITGDFTIGGRKVETMFGRNPFDWTVKANGIAFDHAERIWGKAKHIAGNLWGWAKSHTKLAIGLGIGAVALLGALGYFKGRWIMNWIVAPAVRVGTNAAFGMALWGTKGAIVGAVLGLVHGLQMAHAGTYKKPEAWLAFVLDNTWGLFNTFLGSIWSTANMLKGNEVNKTSSEEYGGLYFKDSWIGTASTTIGNVTAGQAVPSHESVHAWAGRFLPGPFYVPLVLSNYVVASVIPYWLIWKDCPISSFGDYFTKGVYPNTLHEALAYADEGDRCSCC